ncbi:MAG: LytTR family transcriptional regulator, partial [Spirosoma sp.]|nr:LytTR family transcriptional regulator [Spirosoma sp.]
VCKTVLRRVILRLETRWEAGAYRPKFGDPNLHIKALAGFFQKAKVKLPAGAFIRVHKSYLVALDNITRISTRYVTVHEQQIPLGATYREQVEKALRN